MAINFTYEGGPLDGQTLEYNGSTQWFGLEHEGGQYVTQINTYLTNPPVLFWRIDPETPPTEEVEIPENLNAVQFLVGTLNSRIKKILQIQQEEV